MICFSENKHVAAQLKAPSRAEHARPGAAEGLSCGCADYRRDVTPPRLLVSSQGSRQRRYTHTHSTSRSAFHLLSLAFKDWSCVSSRQPFRKTHPKNTSHPHTLPRISMSHWRNSNERLSGRQQSLRLQNGSLHINITLH